MLIGYNYNLTRLMTDTKFIMNELQRYESLLHQAKVFNIRGIVGGSGGMGGSGGGNMNINIEEDIWEENEVSSLSVTPKKSDLDLEVERAAIGSGS